MIRRFFASTVNNINSNNPPSVLQDGNTFGWYIYDDNSNITKDGSNRVSEWRDYLGSGRNLSSSVNPDFNPTWSASGISFDGVYNHLGGTFTLNLPVFFYVVISISSTGLNFGRLFSGMVSNSPQVFVNNLTTTPKLNANGDSFQFDNNTLIVDSFIIIRVLFNGNNSKSIINNLTEVTGNTGTVNMGGVIFGSEQMGYLGSHAKMIVKEVIARNISDNISNETDIFSYLQNKYSL